MAVGISVDVLNKPLYQQKKPHFSITRHARKEKKNRGITISEYMRYIVGSQKHQMFAFYCSKNRNVIKHDWIS